MTNAKETMKSLNKKYGDNAIMKIGERDIDVEIIKTGCYSLDYIFGCDGLPIGRIIEIAGQESSGKTTLALYLIAQVQKMGGKALFIDAEQSFPAKFAPIIGVDVKNLMFVQPTTGEEALDIAEKMVDSGEVNIVVVDSVAALVPEAEIEGGMEKQQMALQARMMSKALRLLTSKVAKNKVIFIFINQLREKVGVYFGDKNVSSGGKALKFYASVRIMVRSLKKLKNKKDEFVGNKLEIKAVKNKVGEPWRKAEFDLYFESGLDIIEDTLGMAINNGIVKRSGSTYSYGDVKLAVGRDHTKQFLEKNPEVLEKIRKDIGKNEVSKSK